MNVSKVATDVTDRLSFELSSVHGDLFDHSSNILISGPCKYFREVVYSSIASRDARAITAFQLIHDKVEHVLQLCERVVISNFHSQ